MPTKIKSLLSPLRKGILNAMFRQVKVLLSLVAVTIGMGCSSSTTHKSQSDQYPVRSDWLVKDVPSGSGQPSKWYDSGYPPSAMLNRPLDTLTGDYALLAAQARSRVILNTAKIDDEVRDAFGKVLTELFGTPEEPRVPSGDALIAELKMAEKLHEVKKSFQEVRDRVAIARQNAKTPEDTQAADAIDKSSQVLEQEVKKYEDKVEVLRVYESELSVDPKTLHDGGIVYRNYCQQCHGLTGDGNGPTARFLIPLPRDYRQGLFKFITTDPSLGSKRKPRRVDLYRSITQGLDGSPMPQFAGLQEEEIQAVISYVIHLSMRGEAEYQVMRKAADPGAEEMSKEDVRKEVVKAIGEIAPIWMASARTPLIPDPDPYITQEQIQNSAENGYKLFTSATVGCTTCHTNFGRSAPYQFDAWGSITRPRNLTIPILRGGDSPEAIYSRIDGGIPGSNMPDHAKILRPTDEDKAKNINKIWDLVHFIQFLSESEKRQVLKDKFQIEIDQ